MATSHSKNRTTVRALPVGLRAARLGIRVLSPHAPELASLVAEELFLTAQRHRRPTWEVDALSTARAFRVPYGDGFLPAWSWGEGTDVALLVHGWEGRGSQLARFVEPLLREGFRVVAFDAPGHGDAPSRRGSVVDHARAVDAVARCLGRVDLVVGHSVGAAASLLATRFGFEPRRVVLISPPIGPARFAAGFVQMLELSKGIETGMVGRLQRRYGIALDELDASADASKVLVPLLVVHDKSDKVVPEVDGATIARSAPQGRLMATEGLGHYRILKDPTVIEEAVRFAIEGRSAPVGSFAATLDGELFFRENRR